MTKCWRHWQSNDSWNAQPEVVKELEPFLTKLSCLELWTVLSKIIAKLAKYYEHDISQLCLRNGWHIFYTKFHYSLIKKWQIKSLLFILLYQIPKLTTNQYNEWRKSRRKKVCTYFDRKALCCCLLSVSNTLTDNDCRSQSAMCSNWGYWNWQIFANFQVCGR